MILKPILCVLGFLCCNVCCFSVGTVLFTTADLVRQCWSDNDKSLLAARRTMQGILPEPNSIDFKNPRAMNILMEYFRSCFDIIARSTEGKSRQIMLMALADSIGGYYKSFILPVAKRAFYSGQIDYKDTKALFDLHDNIKTFLKTTGEGWAKSHGDFGIKFDVKPLKISNSGGRTACRNLYLKDWEEPLTAKKDNQFSNLEGDTLPSRKTYEMLNDRMKESIEAQTNRVNLATREKRGKLMIPLPLLDSHTTPHSIALPFRKHPLRSLQSRSAIFILERYYSNAVKCIYSQSNTPEDLQMFNSRIYSWVVSNVFPHLNEEKWYPAFGGVLRIVESIKMNGMDRSGLTSPLQTRNVRFLFREGAAIDGSGWDRPHVTVTSEEDSWVSRRYVLLIFTSLLLSSLVVIGLCCLCCRREDSDTNVLMKADEKATPADSNSNLTVQLIIRFFKNLRKTNASEKVSPETIQQTPSRDDQEISTSSGQQGTSLAGTSTTSSVSRKSKEVETNELLPDNAEPNVEPAADSSDKQDKKSDSKGSIVEREVRAVEDKTDLLKTEEYNRKEVMDGFPTPAQDQGDKRGNQEIRESFLGELNPMNGPETEKTAAGTSYEGSKTELYSDTAGLLVNTEEKNDPYNSYTTVKNDEMPVGRSNSVMMEAAKTISEKSPSCSLQCTKRGASSSEGSLNKGDSKMQYNVILPTPKMSTIWPLSSKAQGLRNFKMDRSGWQTPAKFPESTTTADDQASFKTFWKKSSSSRCRSSTGVPDVTSTSSANSKKVKLCRKISEKTLLKCSSEDDCHKPCFNNDNTELKFDYAKVCPYPLVTTSSNTCSNTRVDDEYSSTNLLHHIVACHSTLTNSSHTFTQESDSDTSERRSTTSSCTDSSARPYTSAKKTAKQ